MNNLRQDCINQPVVEGSKQQAAKTRLSMQKSRMAQRLTAGVRVCMYNSASAISISHCTACSVLYKPLLGFTICGVQHTLAPKHKERFASAPLQLHMKQAVSSK